VQQNKNEGSAQDFEKVMGISRQLSDIKLFFIPNTSLRTFKK